MEPSGPPRHPASGDRPVVVHDVLNPAPPSTSPAAMSYYPVVVHHLRNNSSTPIGSSDVDVDVDVDVVDISSTNITPYDLPPSSRPSRPPRSTRHHQTPVTTSAPDTSRLRKHSIPFSFPPFQQQPTSSSTSPSLVPSTARGRPIPLDDATTSHRTSALRELNSHYPSRHRYAKSTGAQSTTYSQPVIVRTYGGPPSRPHSATRGGRVSSTASRLKYPFSSSASTTQTTPAVRHVGPGLLSSSMVGTKHLTKGQTRRGRGRSDDQPARLPPVEAFSFKSFMADVSLQQDIEGDLDRIAEICARSRYSLSNQYEVHMTPHGSGSAFLSTSTPSRGGGPTLQAVSSDDERGHRKRRSTAGRRRSVAYGTLETIMSSSRSSEEDKKQKKKSAAQIADDVRGRASRKDSVDARETAPSSQSSSTRKDQEDPYPGTPGTPKEAEAAARLARKKSASFATAIIDTSRHHTHVPAVPQVPGEFSTSSQDQGMTSPRSSTAALHSEPAQPQTWNSHLEIRTMPDQANGSGSYLHHESQPQSPVRTLTGEGDVALDRFREVPQDGEDDAAQGPGILSGLSSWIPWGGVERSGSGGGERRNGAEGSLRQLLRQESGNLGKGKVVDRAYHY